jgi:hypothetical protein
MFSKIISCSIFLLSLFLYSKSSAQQIPDTTINKAQDSTGRKNILTLDTSAQIHNPKIATFRSAVLPGWGQAYNKKYWKIPIIYGALGVTAGVFAYNLKTYKRLKEAIILRSDTDPLNDTLVYKDFRNLSTESIRSYRNSYRQNVDYSVLFFIAFWALNVVDATVDAHLKSFDVSDNISLGIKPRYDPAVKTGNLSFVFSFKEKQPKALPSQR